jgi:hypothetical protein
MGGAVRIDKILTAPRRADSSQYIVRMHGRFAIFSLLQMHRDSRRKQRRQKKSEIVNLKN